MSAATLLGSPWLHPLNDVAAINDWLSVLRPTWSLTERRARIEAVRPETPDTATFELAPNWRWKGFRAGQHVLVELEVAGVRHQRVFTLSSAPSDGVLSITVKKQGLVTGAMHSGLTAGDVVTLSQPFGDFVLPDPLPERLVLIGAGTGMTPIRSMLRELAARGGSCLVQLVQVFSEGRGRLFGAELDTLAHAHPALTVHAWNTDARGRPTASNLVDLVGGLDAAEVFVCGPTAFSEALTQHCSFRHLGKRLHTEHFSPPVLAATVGDGPFEVRAERSGHTFASTADTLLVSAEAAGLRPQHGCRMGVCQGCKVRKTFGVTEDLRTGVTSSTPGELVSLCVTAARSDLILDL